MTDYDKRLNDPNYCKWLERELWIRAEDYMSDPLEDVWETYLIDRGRTRKPQTVENHITKDAVYKPFP